ncbi:MAG: hypothetical protein SAMD01599839_10840 [Rectinema sp.]
MNLGRMIVEYESIFAVLAYGGDMKRFESLSQLVNYIGFSPRLYASGDIERRGSITKRGNPQVRWLIDSVGVVHGAEQSGQSTERSF